MNRTFAILSLQNHKNPYKCKQGLYKNDYANCRISVDAGTQACTAAYVSMKLTSTLVVKTFKQKRKPRMSTTKAKQWFIQDGCFEVAVPVLQGIHRILDNGLKFPWKRSKTHKYLTIKQRRNGLLTRHTNKKRCWKGE